MAAITFVTAPGGRYKKLQSAATGTTTDWIQTPAWAKFAVVHLDISTAGTNTILTIKAGSPLTIPYDDTRAITILTSATITGLSYHQYIIGDIGATAIADSATVSTMVTLATVVPALLGITTTPTGSTYTTAVEFRGE